MRRAAPKPDPVVSLRGLLHPVLGPVLRGAATGADGRTVKGFWLIDTGASLSAIDREVARTLELPSPGAAEWRALTDRPEAAVAALRRCYLSLGEHPRAWEIDCIEIPGLGRHADGVRLIGLVGWDLLDQCRLTVDGPSRTFRLEVPT